MLSYALLMALLYGTENKNLRTLLAMATAFTMLKGKSNKRVRRPRSKRARRIMAARAAERENNSGDTLGKIEVLLPIVAKVLETITVKAKDSGAEQKIDENKVCKRSIRNVPRNSGEDEEPRDNSEYRENRSIQQAAESPVASPLQNDLETKTVHDSEIVEETKESSEAGAVYKISNFPLDYEEENIAETIKELFHGTNVTLVLNNGQNINGEVVGDYKGILILKSSGILNYIREETIVSFY